MPPLISNNHKNTCSPSANNTQYRPDSIASAADSDLDAILCRDGPFTTNNSANSRNRRKSCPMHKGGPSVSISSATSASGPKIINIPPDTSNPVVQVSKAPKQLKGILKGGKSNITPNPLGVPTPPSGASGGKTVEVTVNSREGSFNSDSSPPPLSDPTTSAVHIPKAPKPPLRTSSSITTKSVSEALHV